MDDAGHDQSASQTSASNEPGLSASSLTAAPSAEGVVPGAGKLADKDDKVFGLLARVLGTVTGFIGALVVWLVKKEESPFVNDQGKEALNFQITVLIGYVAAAVLNGILSAIFAPLGCIGGLVILGIMVANIVYCILGGVAANKGTAYRYPCSLRLVK